MGIWCATADMQYKLTTTKSAWFQQKTFAENLSSRLEGSQTPWFSSCSSHNRTTNLVCRPSCSRRILSSCVISKSSTSPFEGLSTGTTRSYLDAQTCVMLWHLCSAPYGQWNQNRQMTGSWSLEHWVGWIRWQATCRWLTWQWWVN